MKDRIEIDGVWYTREIETPKTPKVIPQLEPSISYEGLVFESDLYCFEATRLRDALDGGFYDKQCDIQFTNKKLDIDNIEYWDNTEWMIECLSNDPEAIEEALKSLCPRGMEEFRVVLKELAENDWI